MESSSSSELMPTWGSRHVQSSAHNFLCEVDLDYVTDAFNLTGLKALVPLYREALLILSTPYTGSSSYSAPELVSARLLYGLIHARWIASAKGMAAMVRAWAAAVSASSTIPTHSLIRAARMPLFFLFPPHPHAIS